MCVHGRTSSIVAFQYFGNGLEHTLELVLLLSQRFGIRAHFTRIESCRAGVCVDNTTLGLSIDRATLSQLPTGAVHVLSALHGDRGGDRFVIGISNVTLPASVSR